MDFVSIVLFLAMYYLRPQEWSGIMRSVRPVQLTMYLSLATLLLREKSLRLKDFFRTPHDYALILFFAWLVLTSGHAVEVFKLVLNLMVFYFVIVQTLNSVRRMRLFLGFWCFFIWVVSALAVASEYGFDPFESNMVTHSIMKDRLVLNLSIFNNPNSLAHSVVPVIPMLYFMLLWKRAQVMKLGAIASFVVPLNCIYLTLSKGSFISGFITMLITLTFGRPKWVQILLLAGGLGLGTGALFALPRMSELSKSKSDEAIQGRIAAYTYGYRCVRTKWAGIGYGNWMEGFYRQSHMTIYVKTTVKKGKDYQTIRKPITVHYSKAAHGSFNNMGAELGFTGLALFFGMVWCNMRTLLTCKTTDIEEQRVQRILFVLQMTYLVSSWMVDFGYRPTFFMFTAATAAFHRHLRGIHLQQELELQEEAQKGNWRTRAIQGAPKPAYMQPRPTPGTALAGAGAGAMAQASSSSEAPKPNLVQTWRSAALQRQQQPSVRSVSWRAPVTLEEMKTEGTIRWNKIGLFDAIATVAITQVVVLIWGKVIQTM